MDRAQAHTLEAFTASLLIVSGLIFAVQATAVTPLSASTSNQHIENQERAMAENLLAAAEANGTLQEAIVDWNTSANRWRGAGEFGTFAEHGPPNAFGKALNETFADERIAFNVIVRYRDDPNETASFSNEILVYMGSPSDNAVSAGRTVAITDDTEVGNTGTNVSTAGSNGNFYTETDVAPNSALYTVAEVEVVVWQM